MNDFADNPNASGAPADSGSGQESGAGGGEVTLESLQGSLRQMQEQLQATQGRYEKLKEDVIQNRRRFKGLRDGASLTAGDSGEGSANNAADGDNVPRETQGITREDLRAHREIGAMLASAPPELKERVDAMEDSGAPLTSIRSFLEAAQLGLQLAGRANSNGQTRPAIKGQAASAAHQSAVNHPRSVAEFKALPREERLKLQMDPTFDPMKLSRTKIPRPSEHR